MPAQPQIQQPLPMYVHSAGVNDAPPVQLLSPRYVPLPAPMSRKGSTSTAAPSTSDASPADEAGDCSTDDSPRDWKAALHDGWAAFQGPDSQQACYAIAAFLELTSPAPGEAAAPFRGSGVPKEPAGSDFIETMPRMGHGARWWARYKSSLLCPLTGFPIGQLPYPPFKMHVRHESASTRVLVDGKALAMQFIADGYAAVDGCTLEASDIGALDDHIHQCKLGPFRPNRVQSLAHAVEEASSAAERERARGELERFRVAAREELRRLRRIQLNRMSQGTPSHGGAERGRRGRASRKKLV